MDGALPNDRGTLEDQKESFEAAFEQAASEGIGAPNDTPPEKPPEEQEQALVDSIAPEPPVEPPAEPPVDPPPAEPPAAQVPDGTPPAEDTADQRYRTLQGILKKEKETWEQKERDYQTELEQLKGSQGAPAPAPAPEPAAPPADPVKPGDSFKNLSPEDKAALDEYNDEFDTVSKFEGIKRDAAIDSLRNEFKQALDIVIQAIAPAITTSHEAVEDTHFNAIRGAHSDFETYRDDGSIEAWIDNKPPLLKEAYHKVCEKGTPAEVIELITTFKRENNIEIVKPDLDSPPPPPPPNPKKEEKKQALAGVFNRRGAVNISRPSTDDYEGAFSEAASK